MIFNRKPKPIDKPEDIIFNLQYVHTYENNHGELADLYLMHWNSQTKEMISLAIPHGRNDIAQYIQERLNKV